MPSHPPAEAAIKFQTWVCFLSCVRPITDKNHMPRDTVLLCDWPYTGKNIGMCDAISHKSATFVFFQY